MPHSYPTKSKMDLLQSSNVNKKVGTPSKKNDIKKKISKNENAVNKYLAARREGYSDFRSSEVLKLTAHTHTLKT
jgi:hypothetical protein